MLSSVHGDYGAAVPALLERALDKLVAGVADPATLGAAADLIEQSVRPREIPILDHPDLGLNLINWQVASDTAGEVTLQRSLDAGTLQLINPQLRNEDIGGPHDALHRIADFSSARP